MKKEMKKEMRLIDANLLSECLLELEVNGGHWLYRKACDEMIQGFFPKIINEQPTVEALEVVHGRWIETEEGTICSECNEHPFEDGEYAIANYKANYCPNCGARMDGGVENGC